MLYFVFVLTVTILRLESLLFPERQICRERVGEILTEKVLYIADIMNRHEYVPKIPNQTEVDLIFDTSYADVQPYLHRVSKVMW